MTLYESTMDACPTDEELGAFVELRLASEERTGVEEHLAGCASCLDVVAAMLPESLKAPDVAPVTSQPSPRRVPARDRNRWRRWAIAAGIVLAGSAALLALLQRPLVDRLGPGLTRLATRWLGTDMHADAFTVRLGSSPGTFVVTLRDVKIGGDLGMFVRADEIGLTVALAAPMFGAPPISQLRVVGPIVEILGPESMALAWPARDRERVLALLSQSDRLDVLEGRFVVRGATGAALVIDHVAGGLERTADGVKIALQGRVASGSVDVVGTLGADDHRLTLTVAGRDLDTVAVPLLAQRMTGVADLRLDLTSRGDDLRADGRIAVRKGRLVGRGTSRVLALDGPTAARLAEVAPSLVGDDLAFDEARAIFAWRGGTWRLPRIFLTTGPTIVGGRARVDADGDVTGQGTLHLPADLVASLGAQAPALESFLDPTGAAILPFGVGGTVATPQFSLGRP